MKLSPYYSLDGALRRAAGRRGADGLVLFNRFYQPDIDLETLDVVPRLELSSPWDLRLPDALDRHPAAAAPDDLPRGHVRHRRPAPMSAKAIAVGADVAMMTSAVLRHGPEQFAATIAGLQGWLDEHDYESVDQLRGSMSHATSPDPGAFERANYLRVLHSWSTPRPPPPASPTSCGPSGGPPMSPPNSGMCHSRGMRPSPSTEPSARTVRGQGAPVGVG